MALLFRQEGYDLILREDIGAVPPQFTKGTLVSVELTDDTFVYSDKLMLLFVPDDGRRKRAPAIIELHKTTTDDLMYYSGTISRAAMMHDGPVLVALAGMTETDTITSNAYPMIVGKSIDPEEGLLAEPATLSEVIDGSVDAWIAANGIPVDDTLSLAGKPADAAAVGTMLGSLGTSKLAYTDITFTEQNNGDSAVIQVQSPDGGSVKQIELPSVQNVSQIKEDLSSKINLPVDDKGNTQNGTSEQILATNGDGTTQWVDKPEGVEDGSVSPIKTTFMVETYLEFIPDSYASETWRFAVKNTGSIHAHVWNQNYNLVSAVSAKFIRIKAVSAYINFAWASSQPIANTVFNPVAYGGTYDGYTNLNGTDTLSPTEHTVIIQKPDDADYLVVDFGYTKPTNILFEQWDSTTWHLNDGSFTDDSVPDNTINGSKIKNDSIAEEQISSGAVTSDKIAANAIDGDKLMNDYHRNSSVYLENSNVIFIAKGYETYTSSLRIATTYPDKSCLFAYKMEAHKSYQISASQANGSVYNDLFQPRNPDNVPYVNEGGGFISIMLIDANGIETTVKNTQGYVCSVDAASAFRNVPAEYGTVYGDTGTAYSGRYLTVGDTDLYLYYCAIPPEADKRYMETSLSGRVISEVNMEEIAYDGVNATDFNTVNISASTQYINRFDRSYSGFSTSGNDIASDFIYGTTIKNSEKLRDVLEQNKKPLTGLLVGDSITYAASNAGLQNAWRKYISARMGLFETNVLAVSGTGIIDGAPYDFLGNAKTSEEYQIALSGVSGLMDWVRAAINGDASTWTHSGISNTLHKSRMLSHKDIAIIALGTNDWSNGGTLGSISTLDDTTTFYGAVYTLYNFLMDTLNIEDVLFVAPFPRKDGAGLNSASTPYYLWEMAHALAEIAVIQPHMHVLDLTGAWYFNTSDANIASKAFIDNVHISGWAHHLVTMDMAREIERIIAYSDTYRRDT